MKIVIFLSLLNFIFSASFTKFQHVRGLPSGSFVLEGHLGTKGVFDDPNQPCGRVGFMVWEWDSSFYLSHGEGFIEPKLAFMDDVWEYSLSLDQWRWVAGEGDGGVLQSHTGYVGEYNSLNNPGGWIQMVSFDGLVSGERYFTLGRDIENDYTNQIWVLNTLTSEWKMLRDRGSCDMGTKGGNFNVSVFPHPVVLGASARGDHDNIFVFGGYGVYNWNVGCFGTGLTSDLYEFDIASSAWRWVSGPGDNDILGEYGEKGTYNVNNYPPARKFSHMWFFDDFLYVFGGSIRREYSSDCFEDMWKYDIATDLWVWISGRSGVEGGASAPAVVHQFDPRVNPSARSAGFYFQKGSYLYLYGGMKGTSFYYGDLYVYSTEQAMWKLASGTLEKNTKDNVVDRIPASRLTRGAALEYNNRVYIINGGTNGTTKRPYNYTTTTTTTSWWYTYGTSTTWTTYTHTITVSTTATINYYFLDSIWYYDGFLCYDFFHDDQVKVCSGGGVCGNIDNCSCHNTGFSGLECENFDCTVIAGLCGNGTCNPGTKVCDCETDWAGILCDKKKCLSGCVNGDCNVPNECNCYPGWNGTLCDEAICDDDPGCLNGGICVSPNHCDCSGTGYRGVNCELDDPVICLYGCDQGDCSISDTCNCFEGYNGTRCDESVCVPACENGFCDDNHECDCGGDYEGNLCETPICRDGCSPRGGTCEVPGECVCLAGLWEGDDCDEAICLEGCEAGDCYNMPGECLCADGWTGKYCDTFEVVGASRERCFVLRGCLLFVVVLYLLIGENNLHFG